MEGGREGERKSSCTASGQGSAFTMVLVRRREEEEDW